MFRSIWFWVILALVGLALWLGRDQIASFFSQLPMTMQPRTTNTQELAAGQPATSPGAASASSEVPFVTVPPGESGSTTTTSGITTHVVKKGETLYSISKTYNTTVEELKQLNGITDPTTLAAGQQLKVPAPAAPVTTQPAQPARTEGTTSYTVKKGDTLSSIARQFNTSVATLQSLNNLSNPNNLQVGTVILVPASKVTPTVAVATPTPIVVTPPPQPTVTAAADGEVHSLPVLATPETSFSTESQQPAPTATPIPPASSICNGTQEAVYVWGVSFCVPDGWQLTELTDPNRTALLSKDEASQDRSIYAISRLEGSPNAPLSLSMRQAKKAITSEAAGWIPGGLEQPEAWTTATNISIDDNEGQLSEATTIYLKTGHKAHVRVVVFNHGEQRWRIIIVTPEELWQEYDTMVFPYITRTMDVF